MEIYTDGVPRFLTDVEFHEPNEVVSVPVIPNWDWKLSDTGKGHLTAPDGTRHCSFDLLNHTIQFEPNGDFLTAPGLSLTIVQEMGEQYAYDVVFGEEERAAYDDHIVIRNNTKKMHDIDVRKQLKGTIQMERKGSDWLAHVDTEKVRDLTGIESPATISIKEGTELFNRMSECLHAKPLRDPSGYMALEGNMYEFINREYRNQYENILQAIDNQMVDGTGYGVSHVLDTLQSTVRKDVSEYLPKGLFYGDLRFIKATDERKQAAQEFVKCRISKTLTYEKKRSYEPSAIEKTNAKFVAAGERLGAVLAGPENSEQLSM